MKCFNCHKKITIRTSVSIDDEVVCKDCYEYYERKFID
jgi:DNA-directed RNA polymerase subunit RPC12/RpoP